MTLASRYIGCGEQENMGGSLDSTSHYDLGGNWMNLMMETGYSGHYRLGMQLYRELRWDDLVLHGQHIMGNGQTYGS